LEGEWALISAALPHLPNGNYRTLQDVCKLIGGFLEFSGRWTEWLKLSLQAESKAIAVYDFDNAGWRAFDAGWVYYLLHQPANVLTYASRAETHWKKSNYGYMENAAILKLRGMAYQLKHNFDLAIQAFYESVELQIRIRPESKNVAMSLNDLAEAERLAGNYKAAERELKSALRISQSLADDQEGTAIYLCNLAGLALDQGFWQQAEEYAKKALPIAEVVERQELIASDCLRLAKAITKQDRFAEGLPYLRRAIEIFSRLHAKELKEAQELLKIVEQETRNQRSTD
jgi:tetratricopeptide (TPR) repeat protein